MTTTQEYMVKCFMDGMKLQESKQFIETNTGAIITKKELKEIVKIVKTNTGKDWK